MNNNDAMDLSQMRSRLVKAAGEILERKGRQATVEEIAALAGLSVPVTYQFVKKPADFMLLILEDLQGRFAALVQPELASGNSHQKRLLKAIATYYQVVDEERAKVLLLYRASRTLDQAGRKRIMALELEAVGLFRGILEEGRQAGVFHFTDPDLTAYNIVMLGHQWALKSWHFKRRGMDLGQYIAAQQELILSMVKA
jgi:AcrR family transcriptional regulator